MHKVLSSSVLLVAEKFLQRSIGLISTLILARILTPTDFGVIAKAMLVLWFVQTLAAAGTEPYILQKEVVSDDDLNTAWTLNFILKIFAYFVLLIIAFSYKIKTENLDLFVIIICIGSVLVISAFNNPGLLKLKRLQDYRKIVTALVIVKFISVIIVVPMALIFENYWAIVIGQVASSIMSSVSSYIICDYRPSFRMKNIKDQWDFSKWLIPQEILGYFRVHIDTLIVGAKFESGVLGAYNNMKYFATIPMLQFISPIVAPLHAELGKVQRNQNEMKFQIHFTAFVLGFIICPIVTVLFFGSEQIVLIILGEQWVDYHAIFGILSLGTIPFVLISQSNRFLMIKSKTKYIMLFEAITALLIFSVLLGFDFKTIEAFTFIKFSIEITLAILYFQFSYRYCFGKSPWKSLLLILYPSFVVGSFTYFFLRLFDMPANSFFYVVVLGVVVFLLSFFMTFIHFQLILNDREKFLILNIIKIKLK